MPIPRRQSRGRGGSEPTTSRPFLGRDRVAVAVFRNRALRLGILMVRDCYSGCETGRPSASRSCRQHDGKSRDDAVMQTSMMLTRMQTAKHAFKRLCVKYEWLLVKCALSRTTNCALGVVQYSCRERRTRDSYRGLSSATPSSLFTPSISAISRPHGSTARAAR